jgi:hypothetical protein
MPVTESVVLPPDFRVDPPWSNQNQRKSSRLALINFNEIQIGHRKLSKKRITD